MRAAREVAWGGEGAPVSPSASVELLKGSSSSCVSVGWHLGYQERGNENGSGEGIGMEKERMWFQQRGKDVEVEMLAEKASGDYWGVHPPSLENLSGSVSCCWRSLHGAAVTLLYNWGIGDPCPAQHARVTLEAVRNEQSHWAT